MAIVSIASADTITLLSTVAEVSGTTTINTINGPGGVPFPDGTLVKLWPTGAFSFGAAGNIVASTVAQVSGTPVFLFSRGGVLTQVGVVGYGSTGTGNLVRDTSPTIVTPTIASFANAQHNHTTEAGGGQITSAAISGVTGSGNVALATGPTLTDPLFTGSLKCKGRTSSAGVASTTEYPADKDFGIHKNTATGTIHLAYNDGGAIKTALLV